MFLSLTALSYDVVLDVHHRTVRGFSLRRNQLNYREVTGISRVLVVKPLPRLRLGMGIHRHHPSRAVPAVSSQLSVRLVLSRQDDHLAGRLSRVPGGTFSCHHEMPRMAIGIKNCSRD